MRDILKTCPPELVSRYENTAEKALDGSRVAAIKIKCLECCGWDYTLVRRCGIDSCGLWEFRPWRED